MVFDETTQVSRTEHDLLVMYLLVSAWYTVQEWKPRWGYKRVDDPKEKWVIEIPETSGNMHYVSGLHLEIDWGGKMSIYKRRGGAKPCLHVCKYTC